MEYIYNKTVTPTTYTIYIIIIVTIVHTFRHSYYDSITFGFLCLSSFFINPHPLRLLWPDFFNFVLLYVGETGTKCGQAVARHSHTEYTQWNDRGGDHTARVTLRASHQRARTQREKSGEKLLCTSYIYIYVCSNLVKGVLLWVSVQLETLKDFQFMSLFFQDFAVSN